MTGSHPASSASPTPPGLSLTRDDAERVAPGKYKFLGDSKIILVKLLGSELTARIGNANINLRKYLLDKTR